MADRRALIYGDSNSFGTAPMPTLGADVVHAPGARWGEVMATALGPGWDIVIEGLPGRTTVHDDPIEGAYRNGLTVLPAILHSHKPIDILIICLGANDQKARFSLPAVDIALGMARLVREARASGTVGQVLLVVPPMVRERGALAEMFAGAEARGTGVADHAADLAEAEGARVYDAGSLIEVDLLDGVHWSAEAHSTLGLKIAEILQEMI